ncbi:hypothetical protein fugu_015598 [Takifugu bimaculatus]|uniref:Uncharacterized protein n=1 Tax=Takifugu bimaculatus TaxID=433685 RepID=A0A4Z2BZP2_9TELE|nr:hypothetical protein fugu_015598 [Takifugu bimaculatus]
MRDPRATENLTQDPFCQEMERGQGAQRQTAGEKEDVLEDTWKNTPRPSDTIAATAVTARLTHAPAHVYTLTPMKKKVHAKKFGNSALRQSLTVNKMALQSLQSKVQRGNRDRTMNMDYMVRAPRGGYRGEECRGEEEKLKEPAELWLMNILTVALQNNLPQSQTIDEAFQMN